MDDTSPAADRSAQPSGGAVEPAARKAADPDKGRVPETEGGERYELRDPFSEVTYSSRTLGDMVGKAEQLGAHRFVAIDAKGQRDFFERNDGQWQRRPAVAQERDGNPESAPTNQAVAPGDVTKDEPRPSGRTGAAEGPTTTRAITAAERAARVALLEAALQERYVIKRAPLSVGDVAIGKTEYRFRGDSTRVAFTESTFRLATDTNSPSVARSMVDVAQARNWSALRVTGHEDFKRLVWLEASVRGVKAIGYEPNAADHEALRREREARQVNRIELASSATPPAASEKSSARGGGGRKAVMAAIEAVLVAKGIAAQQRDAVLSAAAEKLAQRERQGRSPTVKMYDKAAPTQRPIAAPARETEPTRGERAR